ncbi:MULTISPECIES: IclR family transcriptional regulator [Polaromonas]|uniref:IclR family transcriptional regulator n=1 Tax=Polaromonas aquatica TaxID=332657 RepID=A0ABW1TY78_9BURK
MKEAAGEMKGTLRRAFSVMRYLATAGSRGAALTDIAKYVGLPHPTVHRLLHQLIEERMVRQLESEKRYTLGSLTFELGLSAAQQFDIRGLCRPVLERLALEAGDTAYLVIRSGDEAVCIDRQEGPSPIRVMTLQVGSRRPLGVGAGGLAILAALPTPEQQAVLDTVDAQIAGVWGLPRDFLQSSIHDANRQGYALIRNRVTPGVSAIGMHFSDSMGRPFAALSVAAINSRLTSSRIKTVSALLTRGVSNIRQALRTTNGRWTAPQPGPATSMD